MAASVPLRAAADAAGKHLWMTENAGGTYNVTAFFHFSVHSSTTSMALAETLAVAASVPLRAAADAAGKRLWMTEYAGGIYNVTDIETGLALSTQVCFGSCAILCWLRSANHCAT